MRGGSRAEAAKTLSECDPRVRNLILTGGPLQLHRQLRHLIHAQRTNGITAGLTATHGRERQRAIVRNHSIRRKLRRCAPLRKATRL